MLDCVLGEGCRIRKSNLVAGIEIATPCPENVRDALMALIRDVIEALFELALAVLFSFPRKGSQLRFS